MVRFTLLPYPIRILSSSIYKCLCIIINDIVFILQLNHMKPHAILFGSYALSKKFHNRPPCFKEVFDFVDFCCSKSVILVATTFEIFMIQRAQFNLLPSLKSIIRRKDFNSYHHRNLCQVTYQ